MASVGFFGKIPSQGDFVRVNAADAVCIAFDEWLAEGVEGMQRAGVSLPSEPVNFFFRAPASKNSLVGVFAPSVDSVGRRYPMVVFCLVELSALATRYPGIPVAFSSFFASASAIVAQSSRLTGARLSELVRALSAPTSADLSVVDTVCRRTLDESRAADMQRRVFGDPGVGKQYYGFKTFLNACEPARGREPAKTNVTLDCPIAGEVDLFTWLELSRRALRWSAPPTFYWSESANSRVLLPVGPPPPAVLTYFGQKDSSAAKLWPVLTDRADAVAAAKAQLRDGQRRALEDPNLVLEGFLAALAS